MATDYKTKTRIRSADISDEGRSAKSKQPLRIRVLLNPGPCRPSEGTNKLGAFGEDSKKAEALEFVEERIKNVINSVFAEFFGEGIPRQSEPSVKQRAH